MTQIQGIFQEQICAIKKKALKFRAERDPQKAIAVWIEKDYLLSEGEGNALVIILNSRGCSWGLSEEGGCSMCGYSNETSSEITADDLKCQMKTALAKVSSKNFEAIKIFNSGSFLDDAEIPESVQKDIFKTIAEQDQIKEIIIESRPEYVTKKKLQTLTKILRDDQQLEIGIGLESSNDKIRVHYINKGFLFEDYKKAVDIATKQKVRVKTYLLLKPPFLTEKEAIEDTIQSALDAIRAGSRTISINPVNVQSGTLVYALWKDGLYRSPWFWSLSQVIQTLWDTIETDGLSKQIDRIVSDPSGSGTQRGIHNCRKCNKEAAKLLKEYSLKQAPKILEKLQCGCKELWQEMVQQEELTRDSSLHIIESGEKFFV